MPDIPFYDRSETERVEITMAAIEEGRTVLERWSVLESKEANPWSARAAMAAKWLGNEAGVVDLGCGTMNLERHLRANQIYIPIDVVVRDSRTLVCDFNRETPPKTSASAAACLGLIEYLHKPVELMTALSKQYRSAVVSYCVIDAPQKFHNRRGHGWVNDFNTTDVKDLFQFSGWSVEEIAGVDNIQKLFRLISVNITS